MAPRVTSNFRTAPAQQVALLVDASTAIATYNEASVAVSPTSSTGKHNLAFTVSNLTGTSPTVTVSLQHSYDNVNFTNVGSGSSTAIAANGTTFASTTAGTVGPFVRAVVTYGGTVTTSTVTVADFLSVS